MKDKNILSQTLLNLDNLIQWGYDKKIICTDYKKLPENADAFVIFSGHPGAAEPAIEAWLTDLKNTGKPKKLVFLGLYDNQGNTDFSQSGLQYNTGSEVEMYIRYCRSLGISEEILQECLVTPKDTSTEDNTQLLAEIRNKYFNKNKDASDFNENLYPWLLSFVKALKEGVDNLEPLVKFSLSSCFRFLFTLYAWFFVMFTFTNFLLNTCFCTVSFKST